MTEISGEELAEILAAGEFNGGTGGYLQTPSILHEKEEIYVGEVLLDKSRNYKVVTSSFMASGRENNLESLAQYSWKNQDSLQGTPNDIRHLAIAFFKNQMP